MSTRNVPGRDSDRKHLAGGIGGHPEGASRRRCHSLPFECRRLSGRLPGVVSSRTHAAEGKAQPGSVCDVTQIEAVIETMATFEQRILFLFNPGNVAVSRARLGRTCCSVRLLPPFFPALGGGGGGGGGSRSQRS